MYSIFSLISLSFFHSLEFGNGSIQSQLRQVFAKRAFLGRLVVDCLRLANGFHQFSDQLLIQVLKRRDFEQVGRILAGYLKIIVENWVQNS